MEGSPHGAIHARSPPARGLRASQATNRCRPPPGAVEAPSARASWGPLRPLRVTLNLTECRETRQQFSRQRVPRDTPRPHPPELAASLGCQAAARAPCQIPRSSPRRPGVASQTRKSRSFGLRTHSQTSPLPLPQAPGTSLQVEFLLRITSF